ncbi:hypothetical protein AB0N28_19760, partial [Streptomyces sp. NPDC051130]
PRPSVTPPSVRPARRSASASTPSWPRSTARTSLALLTGRRRARLRALTEVADLYALDGQWQHPSPWRERPVPVSRLLADVHERVAVEAYRRATAAAEPGAADRIQRALDRLAGAAELTSTGKRLVAELRWESKAVDA